MTDRLSESPEARAWRAAYQDGMQTGGEGCPDEEALAALVLAELGAARREAVAAHVAGCRRCARGYRTLRALHAEARRERVRRPGRVAAAAAGLAAVLAVALVWLPRTPAPAGPDPAVRRDAAPELSVHPADGAVLAEPPERLAWPPQPGATGYSARLYDASAEPLWEGPWTRAAEVELPAEARERMLPGAAYFWVVAVDGPAVPRRLGPCWFELRAPE